jgi:hypothetical protein
MNGGVKYQRRCNFVPQDLFVNVKIQWRRSEIVTTKNSGKALRLAGRTAQINHP